MNHWPRFPSEDEFEPDVRDFVASRSLPVQLHRVDADYRYWVNG